MPTAASRYRSHKTTDHFNIKNALAFIQQSNKITDAAALTFFEEHYKNKPIDVALDDILMTKRKHYLDLHQQQGYKIWHNDKDGRWRTYLYHNDGKRELIAKKDKRDLEDIIIQHYETHSSVISIESILEDFYNDRRNHVKETTVTRDHYIFNAHLKDEEIVKKDIRDIKPKELETFLSKKIRTQGLSKDSFDAIKSFLNSIFDFAVLNEYTDRNVARTVRSFGKTFWNLNGRFDKHCLIDDSENIYADDVDDEDNAEVSANRQYYTAEEQQKVISTALSFFVQLNNVSYLAIAMNFCLGLRIAELVALKVKDFDFETNTVHIRRQEVPVHKDGKRAGCRISNKLKTANSNRLLPISPVCKQIFDLIMEYRDRMNVTSEYLFTSCINQERLTTESARSALRKINAGADLPQRSNHKIRKTVLSRLDMSRNFTLERIRELAGHARESVVLYTNYFYTIPDLDGISDCTTYEEVVDYKMPDIQAILSKCNHV